MKPRSLVFKISVIIVALTIAGVMYKRYTVTQNNISDAQKNNKQYLDNLDKLTGKRFSDVTLKDTSGRKVTLTDFKGKIIYLDCWTAYCAPCRAQEPFWEALIDRHRADTSVVFVNLYFGEDETEWKQQVKANPKGGVSLFYNAANIEGREVNVTAFPTYFFIDGDQKIFGFNVRPAEDIANKRSDILVDWILQQAKDGISAKEAAISSLASTPDYMSWQEKYKMKYPNTF